MGAENFNFAPKFPLIGGLFSPNFVWTKIFPQENFAIRLKLFFRGAATTPLLLISQEITLVSAEN